VVKGSYITFVLVGTRRQDVQIINQLQSSKRDLAVIIGYMFLHAVHTIYSPMYEIEILWSILIVCDGSCILVQ
jgi:hypothetical protein